MASNIRDTICKAAWDYPIVNLSNNEISMCCHAKHHKISGEDIDRLGKHIFTKFEPIRQAKLDLLNGIQNKNCSYCWELENKGLRSSRTGFDQFSNYVYSTEYYKGKSETEVASTLLNLTDDQKDDLATNLDYVNNVEIALGNTCDLKCVYCNEYFSTQWITEKIKYNELPISFIKDVDASTNSKLEAVWWEWFNESVSEKTTVVGFIGGEPLIISKLYEYVEKILDRMPHTVIKRPMYLSVVTNFNTPDQYFNKFINLLPRIAETNLILDLNVSLESLGSKTEFIRTGTKWDRLKENIEKTLSIISKLPTINRSGHVYGKSVSFNFMIALNALCISDLPNFMKWVIELQNKYEVPINLRGSQVVYPHWLSPNILPISYITYVDEAIKLLEDEKVKKELYLFGPWDTYIQQLNALKLGIGTNADTAILADFTKNIDKIEVRRGLQFFDTFPEMIDFYIDCKSYE